MKFGQQNTQIPISSRIIIYALVKSFYSSTGLKQCPVFKSQQNDISKRLRLVRHQ